RRRVGRGQAPPVGDVGQGQGVVARVVPVAPAVEDQQHHRLRAAHGCGFRHDVRPRDNGQVHCSAGGSRLGAMNTLRTPLLALALAAAAAAAPALASDDIVRSNGAITTDAGAAYGRLSTTNGSIRLAKGVTAGEASTVNGSITADDDVTAGALETVNGSIRVGERGRVDGGVSTVNGSILVHRGSRVGGTVETVNGAIGL